MCWGERHVNIKCWSVHYVCVGVHHVYWSEHYLYWSAHVAPCTSHMHVDSPCTSHYVCVDWRGHDARHIIHLDSQEVHCYHHSLFRGSVESSTPIRAEVLGTLFDPNISEISGSSGVSVCVCESACLTFVMRVFMCVYVCLSVCGCH